MKWGNAHHYAHRVAWELAHGPVPAGLHVCHACDVPLCVNPRHLFVGTAGANIRDSVQKGRFTAWQRTGLRLNGEPAKARVEVARTHCARGHALSGDNLLKNRACRICNRARWLVYSRQRQAMLGETA